MTAFTPGPWAILRGFPTAVCPANDADKLMGTSDSPDDEAERFAKVIHYQPGTAFPQYSSSRIMRKEAIANARLIAAAPELYDALLSMVCMAEAHLWQEATEGRQSVLRHARVVLAKATGETDPQEAA